VDTHVTIASPIDAVSSTYFGQALLSLEPIVSEMGKGATNQLELSRSDIGAVEIWELPQYLHIEFHRLVEPMLVQAEQLSYGASALHPAGRHLYQPAPRPPGDRQSGALPLGVTPGNVLHASVRRNEHLARLFHDLKLMEREGSGFDAMYDVLLSQGRPAPLVEEGADWVKLTLARTAPDRQVLAFISKASETYPLTQRERIALGLLARDDAMSARELALRLEVRDADALHPWLHRLCEWGLVGQSGRTQATRYFVQPELLRSLAFPATTTLKRIEDHRLRALVLEDLQRYPGSAIGQIHQRIGQEIPRRRSKTLLTALVTTGEVWMTGKLKGARYGLST